MWMAMRIMDRGGKVMKKNIEWAKDKMFDVAWEKTKSKYLIDLEDVYQIIDQLDETEVNLDKAFDKVAESYAMTKEDVWRHLEQIDAYGGKVTYGEPEVLSQEWIEKYQYVGTDPNSAFVYVKDLQNLIVPKQELPIVPTWFDEWWKDIPKGEGNLLHNIAQFHDKLYSYGTREIYDYINDTGNKKKLLDIIVNELDYKVEHKPLYHALIKGYDVSNSDDIYWNYDKYDNDVFVSRLYPSHDNFLTEMSKSEWNGLGINDSNADFVKVDD